MLIGWIIAFSVLGSIASVGAAALLMLLFPDAIRRRLVPCLISYATGTLLGAAFLGSPKRAVRCPAYWHCPRELHLHHRHFPLGSPMTVPANGMPANFSGGGRGYGLNG